MIVIALYTNCITGTFVARGPFETTKDAERWIADQPESSLYNVLEVHEVEE